MVSIHHFPPLRISADEFDAAGTEINVRVSCNKNWWQQTLSILILSKTYPTSEYNLAHIPRHARLWLVVNFAEQALEVSSYFSKF